MYTLNLKREPGWALPPVDLGITADGMKATSVSIDGQATTQSAARMSIDLNQDRVVTVRFEPAGGHDSASNAVAAP